ncbi:MAG TPA: SIS domain-containing protein [Aestuariivirgaceae bacterium]|jgi:glucosamine--fructose-6-phosphate aminotransferase (isomerizing)
MTEPAAHTDMAREMAEAPVAVAAMLQRNRALFAEIAKLLRKRAPTHLLTSARGSSDHAASYLKYLSEILLGLPCCSLGASVVSIYRAQLRLKDTVLFTISQSGQSPDILSLQADARRAGVLCIALTNQENSPLGQGADICLPLHAGLEKSPAATKSFIASTVAAAQLIGMWMADRTMIGAIEHLPDILHKARLADWRDAHETVAQSRSLYVLGRGPSFAMAQEAALKLKETCAIHAEAFSAAEVMHGPLELVGKNFPAFAFCPADAAEASTLQAIGRLRSAGAPAIVAGATVTGDIFLPYVGSAHALLDPISLIQSFYSLVESVARQRGRNPDQPRLLSKETATL